jgi:hypothetical protein
MVRRVVRSWSFAWVSLLAVAIWWGASMLPTSGYWFRADSMLVPDMPVGDDVVMIVDREIRRPVYGTWTVTVRQQQGEEGWRLYCIARGETDYTPLATLPDPVTLNWWTEGGCDDLEAGTYFVTTTWAFRPTWLPGHRRTRPLVSNSFRVLEVAP